MNRPLPSAGLLETQAFLTTPMAKWLGLEALPAAGRFRMRFGERHIGNPWIRALHGGAVGALIEASAELALAQIVGGPVELQSSAIDYLRVTKAVDLYSRAELVRQGRRLAFVDVWCWQDGEDMPVAHGSCTLRIFAAGSENRQRGM
jgi:acyl-coenzyme A thioesterase PaaI-like protein